MAVRWHSLFILASLAGSPVHAQMTVVSGAPSATSVTVYRDPDRGEGRINPQWPAGYALISEKRRISLPAGETTVRFEGVAGGMIAVSAVVSGLPGGVSEKNRDARLLSPASLLDGSLGNRVHIRRTNKVTGKVNEQDAIVRSGPDNAVVLQTANGVEALRCSGLPETLIYDSVPEGLSAKPTFTVHTNSPAATVADVTLTYLATGFDWGASYVAKLSADGRSIDLSAWLTLANGNDVIYPDAQLLAVAGKPNKQSDFDSLVAQAPSPTLNLQCWPMDGTSTHGAWGNAPPFPPPVMVEMAMTAAPMMARGMMADAAVFKSRMAQQEELGDLKLYRVPMPVDVTPNGMKQVALLARNAVPVKQFYGADVSPWGGEGISPLSIKLRMVNKEKEGLGLPLPSGALVVMQRGEGSGGDMLLSDTKLRDYAVGEKVELTAGTSVQVQMEQAVLSATDKERRIRITLTNALDKAVPVEITIQRADGYELAKPSSKWIPKDGNRLWALDLRANGKATLEYIVRR
jgi:hypothetical protein